MVFNMPSNKSPGPDGYTSEFFKASKGTVGDLVTKDILQFFATGRLLRDVNSIVTTHTPKTSSPR